MKKIKFIDLFSGIGGFHLAIENYVFKNKLSSELVLASEIDPKAIETYSANFNVSADNIKNVRDVDTKDIPDFDILFAGFPCQTFSSAGHQLGFKDKTRGTLFFEIERILRAKKPKYFILENVKHLVKHDNGNTYKTIIKHLNAAGYVTNKMDDPLILDSYDCSGSLQKRQRTYILGIRNDMNYDEKALSSIAVKKDLEYKEQKEDVEDFFDKNVSDIYYLENTNEKYVSRVLKAWGEFIKNVMPPAGRGMPVIWADAFTWKTSKKRKEMLAMQPKDHWRTKYYKDMFEVYDLNKKYIDGWMKKFNVKKWNARDKKMEWHVGKESKNIKDGYIQLRQSGVRIRRKGSFPTLVAIGQTPIVFDKKAKKWRFLTVNEEQRLQTFEFADSSKRYKSYFKIRNDNSTLSMNTSYRQFGNAVTVDVIEKLIGYLFNKILVK